MGAARYDAGMTVPLELMKAAEDALRTAQGRGENQIEIST
jgi:hypothetical protein